MNHAIELRLRAAEGSIIRALGLAERRGFTLERLQVDKCADDQLLQLVVSSPSRPVEVLQRQLEKLQDVVDVVIMNEKPMNVPTFTQAVSGG